MAILDKNDPDPKRREMEKAVLYSLIIFTLCTLPLVAIGVYFGYHVSIVAVPLLVVNCVCTVSALQKRNVYLMLPFVFVSGIWFLASVCLMYYAYVLVISPPLKYSTCGKGFFYYDKDANPSLYGYFLFMSYPATLITATVMYAVWKCALYYGKKPVTEGGSDLPLKEKDVKY